MTNAAGEREEWSIKPGDLVTIRINPMKDGTRAGLFVGARLPDATTLGRREP